MALSRALLSVFVAVSFQLFNLKKKNDVTWQLPYTKTTFIYLFIYLFIYSYLVTHTNRAYKTDRTEVVAN